MESFWKAILGSAGPTSTSTSDGGGSSSSSALQNLPSDIWYTTIFSRLNVADIVNVMRSAKWLALRFDLAQSEFWRRSGFKAYEAKFLTAAYRTKRLFQYLRDDKLRKLSASYPRTGQFTWAMMLHCLRSTIPTPRQLEVYFLGKDRELILSAIDGLLYCVQTYRACVSGLLDAQHFFPSSPYQSRESFFAQIFSAYWSSTKDTNTAPLPPSFLPPPFPREICSAALLLFQQHPKLFRLRISPVPDLHQRFLDALQQNSVADLPTKWSFLISHPQASLSQYTVTSHKAEVHFEILGDSIQFTQRSGDVPFVRTFSAVYRPAIRELRWSASLRKQEQNDILSSESNDNIAELDDRGGFCGYWRTSVAFRCYGAFLAFPFTSEQPNYY